MKKFFFILFLPFFCLAQSNKLDEKNGFNTYVFGTSPKDYKNLTLEIDEGNTKLYSLNEVSVNNDGTEFEYVRVTFCKDKLSAISIQTKNLTGQKFLQSLKESYGEPSKVNNQKGIYEWLSSKYQLIYEKNPRTNDATISFYAKTICKNKS